MKNPASYITMSGWDYKEIILTDKWTRWSVCHQFPASMDNISRDRKRKAMKNPASSNINQWLEY